MTNAIIPDVSFYQDDNTTPRGIDFAQMRAAGASGVIIRAGQSGWVDKDFDRNYKAAKAAGLPRGVYFFYDSRTPPNAQAVLCAAQIGSDKPELGTWLDLEENYKGQYQGWTNWKTCLNKLRSLLPSVGIYSNYYYWMERRPTGAADLAYFKTFPFWPAHYGVTTPLIPSPWTSWVFWQFTSSGNGRLFGAESFEIDLNYFNGDVTQFRNYFNLSEQPTQPPTEVNMGVWYRVNVSATSKLQIRDGHGTSYQDIGDLFAGDRIETLVSPIGGWFKINRILRSNGAWETMTGEAWCSGAYLVATPAPVVEPEQPPATGTLPDVLWIGETKETVKEYRKT